ncbi:MAG TPA: polysaccharide deacetylase family protein [Actinomycetota bacterium]|nr:polysaccharide deacetylase family protein [Actinomycetota bacterium]
MSRVALTFDAEHPDRPLCPPGNVERVLDVLRSASVRATFFVQGRWARSQPDAARRIVADGHLVGSHSNYHVRMPYLSDDGIRADVTEAEDAIRETCGIDPRPWFRCPFGEGHGDPRVIGALERLGYRNVHWDVELDDWEPWRTAGEVARDAIAAASAHGDGAIVLLHTWPAPTAEALPRILEGLRETGSILVTVEELEDLP